MVTFDQAFANTRQDTRLSIKKKLEACGYNLEDELDDSFMGLKEKDLEAAGLTRPETTATRHVLDKITGAANSSGQAGIVAGAGVAAGRLSGNRTVGRRGRDRAAKRPKAGPKLVKCNLADIAPALMEVNEKCLAGKANVYMLDDRLYVDTTGVVEALRSWKKRIEDYRLRPTYGGPPPLLIWGLIKTGKTFVLTKILTAVLRESRMLGIGQKAEARVILLDMGTFP